MPAAKSAGQHQAADNLLRRAGRGVRDYLVSLRVEWSKLTFPTRKELVQSTIVVFLFTIVLMAIIALFDALLTVITKEIILPPSIT